MSEQLNQYFSEQIYNYQEYEELYPSKLIKTINTIKIEDSTKWTQQNTAFVEGRNTMLELRSNYLESIDDEQTDSILKQTLNFDFPSSMIQLLNNYGKNTGINLQIISSEQAKLKYGLDKVQDIEKTYFQEVAKQFGFEQWQKMISLTKILKNNNQIAKVYFRLITCIKSGMKIEICYLLKESLWFYLIVRREIRENHPQLTPQLIIQYINKNFQTFCQRIFQNEKLMIFHKESWQKLEETLFKKFIIQWIQSFILCWQGYPNKKFEKSKQKNPNLHIFQPKKVKLD